MNRKQTRATTLLIVFLSLLDLVFTYNLWRQGYLIELSPLSFFLNPLELFVVKIVATIGLGLVGWKYGGRFSLALFGIVLVYITIVTYHLGWFLE